MLRADITTVTHSVRYAWRSSRTSITISTYSSTCIKSCQRKESLIDVRDDFFLRLHGVSLSLASFWVLLLIDSLSITSFLCASLGPGAFSLAHCGSCLVDRGRLDAFTASFTVASPQRSSALFSRVLAGSPPSFAESCQPFHKKQNHPRCVSVSIWFGCL